MSNQPQKQNYESAKKNTSATVDLGFLTIRKGEFIHVGNINGDAVEIRMDDEGQVGVCVSDDVYVSSFEEVYGKS